MTDGESPHSRRARFIVLSAAARGASHDRKGLALQDAATPPAPDGCEAPFVLAVADGHGNRLHPRSGRGASIAVEVATGAGAELGNTLAAATSEEELADAVRQSLVPRIVAGWREAVLADVAEDPFDAEEAAATPQGLDATIAYGTTLVAAVVVGDWLGLCQIGDGDAVVVGTDGRVEMPVPRDPRLERNRTTSLCQPDAEVDFRVAARDLVHRPAAAVMLATDGFGNAQALAGWQEPVTADMLRLAREHGASWVRRELPGWVARCASAEGSGDDTTVVLALAAGALDGDP